MAVERLMGIEVPERAKYIRIILTELNRLSSHFMFVGAFGIDAGLFGTSFTYAFREREYLQDVFEEVSGDRLMYAYFRVGGLAWEVPDNFVQRVHEVLKKTQQGIKDVDDYKYSGFDPIIQQGSLRVAYVDAHTPGRSLGAIIGRQYVPQGLGLEALDRVRA